MEYVGKTGQVRNAIEMITYLEHERRGERGEYKIAYMEEQPECCS